MRNFLCILIGVPFLTSCSSVPPLSLATGATDSKVLVGDIVQRVKCEISDAFDDKLEDPRFSWLRNWTVTTDMTLQASTTGTLSGSGSHTDIYPSIATVASTLAQNFTFGANASYGESANRSDIVSFSLSLWELHDWRRQLDRAERLAAVPDDRLTCNPGGRRELVGHLGLKEWVDAALEPIAAKLLFAGDHPSGSAKATAKGGGSKPTNKRASAGGGAHALAFDIVKDALGRKAHIDALRYAFNDISKSSSDCDDYLKFASTLSDKLTTAQSSFADTKYEADAYGPALAGYFRHGIDVGDRTLKTEGNTAQKDILIIRQNCNPAKSNADKVVGDMKKQITKESAELDEAVAGMTAEEANLYRSGAQKQDEERRGMTADAIFTWGSGLLVPENNFVDVWASARASEYEAQKAYSEAVPFAAHFDALANLNAPDPPITAISHYVQFQIDYGAGVNPNWMLGLWRGPGQSGTLASLNGNRTNILNIAVGPRSTPIKVGDEQARVLLNQTLQNSPRL